MSLRESNDQMVSHITTLSSESYRIYFFQHTMGTKIAIMEKPGHSSVRIPIRGITHLKKCFTQRTKDQGSSGGGVDMVHVFRGLFNRVSSSGYIVSYKTITK
jgi:hypothetical protein